MKLPFLLMFLRSESEWIIDGKAIAAQVKASLQGSDASSLLLWSATTLLPRFMSQQRNACAERSVFGLALAGCRLRRRPKVIASIAELSAWADGILVQLPLRNTLTREGTRQQYRRRGLLPHPYNIEFLDRERLVSGPALRPESSICWETASGKHCVIIGHPAAIS